MNHGKSYCQDMARRKNVSSLIKTFIDQLSVTYVNACNLLNTADTSDEVIGVLKSIDANAFHKGIWLTYIILQMVDPKMREDCALFLSKDNFLSFDHLFQFINDRF